MSRRPAGLTAFVCILIFGMAGRAWGDDLPDADVPFPPQKQRIPVAVIELGDSAANRALADAVGRVINNSEDLKPLDDVTAVNALLESHEDEDAEFVRRAATYRAEAIGSVNTYKFREAASSADNGLSQLYFVTPNPNVLAMSSELAFLLGVSKLGQRDDKGAADEFRLARALDAKFKPDPVRYLPEIVEAFDLAVKSPAGAKGWLGVGPVSGRVFIDGVDRGTSPQTFPDIAPGVHIVWLVDDLRETYAKRVVVPPGKKEEVVLEPPTIDTRKKVKRARRLLKLAPDPAARAAAMQALARMLKVSDAVIFTESNGKTIVQTWREQGLGFSALREVKQDEKPADLLAPFLPPKKPPPVRRPPDTRIPKLVDTRSWYQKPRYQIGGGIVGVVLIGIGLYALSAWDRPGPFVNTDPNFGSTGDTGRR